MIDEYGNILFYSGNLMDPWRHLRPTPERLSIVLREKMQLHYAVLEEALDPFKSAGARQILTKLAHKLAGEVVETCSEMAKVMVYFD